VVRPPLTAGAKIEYKFPVFERFRRRSPATALAPGTVAAGWDTGNTWRAWDPPSAFIVGESHYMEALLAIAGPPRKEGYLMPVAVSVVRERQNPHDPNAFRIEVWGRKVGHLARHIAAQLAPPLDQAGCSEFTVCGVIRGGSLRAPNLGVHAWFDRRLTPGPDIIQRDDTGLVSAWPPREDEGQPAGETNSATSSSGAGFVRGRHFTEYVEKVKTLHRNGQTSEAETLLLELVDATESESRAMGLGVAPWYYEQLAILYSKQGKPDKEIAVLERFARQAHAPGVSPPRLLERLERKRAKRSGKPV
jgi:hypothetical protein